MEDRAIGVTQSEHHREDSLRERQTETEKERQKRKQSLGDLCDNNRRSSICVIRVLEREEKAGRAEKKEIMAENSKFA